MKWAVYYIKQYGHTRFYRAVEAESAEAAFDLAATGNLNPLFAGYYSAFWVQELPDGAPHSTGPRTGFCIDPKLVTIHNWRSLLDARYAIEKKCPPKGPRDDEPFFVLNKAGQPPKKSKKET